MLLLVVDLHSTVEPITHLSGLNFQLYLREVDCQCWHKSSSNGTSEFYLPSANARLPCLLTSHLTKFPIEFRYID